MRSRRESNIIADMERLGIAQSDRINFGRARVSGTGAPTFALCESFAAGDSIETIATDYELTPEQVTNALRFRIRYPRCEQPSFWRFLEGN